MKKGFTLIELLIVVAIIAILAAIAIPNFLAAQVRAKVSRAKAELRTIATGLESYYVDYNNYPHGAYFESDGYDPANGPYGLWALSTPVAYLSDPKLNDPFSKNPQDLSKNYYRYESYTDDSDYVQSGYQSEERSRWGSIPYGEVNNVVANWWCAFSVGPDGYVLASTYDNLKKGGDAPVEEILNTVYDPTNGTTSFGNIYRVGGSSGNGSFRTILGSGK